MLEMLEVSRESGPDEFLGYVKSDFVIEREDFSNLPGVTKEQAGEIRNKALFLIQYFTDLFSSQKTPQPVQC